MAELPGSTTAGTHSRLPGLGFGLHEIRRIQDLNVLETGLAQSILNFLPVRGIALLHARAPAVAPVVCWAKAVPDMARARATAGM